MMRTIIAVIIACVLMTAGTPVASAGTWTYNVNDIDVVVGNVIGGNKESLKYLDGNNFTVNDTAGGLIPWKADFIPNGPWDSTWNQYPDNDDPPYTCALWREYVCTVDDPIFPDYNTTYIFTQEPQNAVTNYTLSDPVMPYDTPNITSVFARINGMKMNDTITRYRVYLRYDRDGDFWLCSELPPNEYVPLTRAYQTFTPLIVEYYAKKSLCRRQGIFEWDTSGGWTWAELLTLQIEHVSVHSGEPTVFANVRITAGRLYAEGTTGNTSSSVEYTFNTIRYGYPDRISVNCSSTGSASMDIMRNSAWVRLTNDTCATGSILLNNTLDGDNVFIRILSKRDNVDDKVSIDRLVLISSGDSGIDFTGSAWWIVWLSLIAVITLLPITIYLWLRKRRLEGHVGG